MKVNIIFPYHITFSPKYGGAASRWIYEVLSRIPQDKTERFRVLLPADRTQALYEIGGIGRPFVSTWANWARENFFFK